MRPTHIPLAVEGLINNALSNQTPVVVTLRRCGWGAAVILCPFLSSSSTYRGSRLTGPVDPYCDVAGTWWARRGTAEPIRD